MTGDFAFVTAAKNVHKLMAQFGLCFIHFESEMEKGNSPFMSEIQL
jgi:hypothetical protein